MIINKIYYKLFLLNYLYSISSLWRYLICNTPSLWLCKKSTGVKIIKLPVLFAVLSAVVPAPFKRRCFAPAVCNHSHPGKAVSPDRRSFNFQGTSLREIFCPSMGSQREEPFLRVFSKLFYFCVKCPSLISTGRG